jgi:transcriptional regulator with XRE-family HTH domain
MAQVNLKAARLAGGWTQFEAASRLGVSQPYYSQLEGGARPVPEELAPLLVRKFRLSPAVLPLPALDPQLAPMEPREVAAELASLGYPGFTHLKKASGALNPALVVAAALAHDDLDTRLVEALPWVLATFRELDWGWLCAQCRLLNLQNRLGYLVWLAQNLAKPGEGAELGEALLELERSRLVVEGTLCKESMPSAERAWVRKHRPAEAKHWNLLTTLTVEQLTHVA